MATITVVEDQQKGSESQEPQKIDTNAEKAVEMEMSAQFGMMKQKFQDNEQKLAQMESERAAERAEREADRAEIRAAHQRIADLTAALEEEEDAQEGVEKVIPPKPEEKVEPTEKPKPHRSMLKKMWLGG